MTETITIECEWDEGDLRLIRVLLNGEEIPTKLGSGQFAICCRADDLAKAIGRWKIEQDKRNVSP